MPRSSKKYFDKKLKNAVWGNFLENINKINSVENLEIFLKKYLSSDEKNLLEKRLVVLKMLDSGLSYRQISEQADVTLKTISFIKRGLVRPVMKKKNSSAKKSSEFSFLHKKNSIMPTYVGKGRWKI